MHIEPGSPSDFEPSELGNQTMHIEFGSPFFSLLITYSSKYETYTISFEPSISSVVYRDNEDHQS